MATPNIRIDIASEFKDRGFKQANKASIGLDRQFKKLAGTFATVFSVRAITQFGKAALKAFQEDEKAAFRLSQTVKNLGLGFADPSLKAYVASLESSANVSDDVLRPALEKLLRTTQSVTQSQQLLNLALDISRGTGTDLVTVASDLSRAYVGQTRGLAKYNIGLTQAELKTKSFAELQEILTKQFSGQSAAYLDTYAGKVEALSIAYDNAREIIGEGLADAFMRLSGDTGIASATNAMEDFANQINDVITGISVMLQKLNSLTTWSGWSLLDTSNLPVVGGWLDFFEELGKKEKANQVIANPAQRISPRNVEAATAAADRAAAKRQKDLIKLQQKAAAEAAKRAKEAAQRERNAQALRRAGTIFDMENIQIVAALQGRISDDQRLRLTALFALNTKNAEAAEKLSLAVLATNSAALASVGVIMKAGDTVDDVIEKIIKAQTSLVLVNSGITSIPKAKNPFEDWPDIIAKILSGLAQIKNSLNSLPGTKTSTGTATGTSGTGNTPEVVDTGGWIGYHRPADFIADAVASITGKYVGTSLATDPNILSGARYNAMLSQIQERNDITNQLATDRYTAMLNDIQTANQITNDLAAARYAAMQEYYVTVNVAGNVTAEQDLVTTITDQLYNVQKSGKSLIYNAVAI